MSATNSTPTINLPLFIGTDKPAWLVDWNGAMNAIDSAIAALQTAESGTAAALSALSNSVTALSNTVSQQTTAIETVTQSVNQLAGNVTTINGNINTINSLIGNGEPTTTDKTIIGAINEINAKIPEGGTVEADDVTYDNQTSGLNATNVQAAIDEVNAKIPAGGAVEADDVSFDNTASGLSATNVQAAIDELAQGGAGHAYSSTEKAVGTFGNKTVYEKTYSGTATANTQTTVDASLTISYVDNVISMDGAFASVGQTTNHWWPLPVRFNTDSSNSISIRPDISASGLVFDNTNSGSQSKYVLTIRYTKA